MYIDPHGTGAVGEGKRRGGPTCSQKKNHLRKIELRVNRSRTNLEMQTNCIIVTSS